MARTALYRHFDADGRLLYVGISECLSERDKQHAATAHWHNDVVRSEAQWCLSRDHALALEAVAIRFENPLHNVALARPAVEPSATAEISQKITHGAERLTEFFKRTGIKRVWLAENLGVSRSHITELCSGKKLPGRDLAFRIEAETLGAVRATSWLRAG